MKVELIPVIEIGFREKEGHLAQPQPDNTYWTAPEEWESYFKEKAKTAGFENYKRIKRGYSFYRVNQFKLKEDVFKIIQFHIGEEEEENRIQLRESCALFGGYLLKVNEQFVFTPQCCSLLSDISTWKLIIQEEFNEGYICYEGHPNPKVERHRNKLKFTFEAKWEDFIPPVINSTVDRVEMIKAVTRCQKELDEFGKVLNSLENEFNQKEIANILIYGKE